MQANKPNEFELHHQTRASTFPDWDFVAAADDFWSPLLTSRPYGQLKQGYNGAHACRPNRVLRRLLRWVRQVGANQEKYQGNNGAVRQVQ